MIEIPKIIIDDNLVLKLISLEDSHELYKVWSSPIVTKYMNIEPMNDEQEALSMIDFFIKSYHSGQAVRYSIFYNNKCIGSCGYNYFKLDDLATEIGYEIASDYQGKGLGTRLVKVLSNVAFNDLKLKMIYAEVEKDNISSQKILLKNNFELVSNNNILKYVKESHNG